MRVSKAHLVAAAVVSIAFASAPPGATADTRAASGSPPTPFSQNKQNEPGLAVNPVDPSMVVAGANDEIDLESCAAGDPTTCPFTEGVGVTGVSFSFDGGQSFQQPDYHGYTARDCLGPADCEPVLGPIGTLPGYYANGLVSDGDPVLAFGPRRGADGRFAWANGVRLYFANLTSSFPGAGAFRGPEAIAVSRTDDIEAAAAGDNGAWLDPVLVTKQSSATFSDKEEIAVDDAQDTSPYFGNVYVCNVSFRGNGTGGGGEPLLFARSTDGGATWQRSSLTSATNNARTGGRQGCAIRTDSHGGVYVYWVGTDIRSGRPVFFQARSADGGVRFERPRVVAAFADVGVFDPAIGQPSFDGVGGARTSVFPSVDIANGAPSGSGATNEIVIAGATGPTPTDKEPGPNERAFIRYSTDGGATFHDGPVASEAGDRPDFPSLAISPDGTDVYVAYDAFMAPWQSDTSKPRVMQGVVRHADVDASGAPGEFTTIHRAVPGDARGSAQNNLVAEFLGDYNYAVATNDGAVAVWNDVRDAGDCPAIDAYRQAFVDSVAAGAAKAAPEETEDRREAGEDVGEDPAAPAPGTDCPATFGNSDTFAGAFPDPTP
jgi:hypothetical protein